MIFMSRYCFISSSSNYIKEVHQKMIFHIPACSIVHMKSQHAAPTTQTPLQTCPLTLTYKARVQSMSTKLTNLNFISKAEDVHLHLNGSYTGLSASRNPDPWTYLSVIEFQATSDKASPSADQKDLRSVPANTPTM